jgi:hypothetical protein
MKGKQGDTSSKVVQFRMPSPTAGAGLLSPGEGLELIEAFAKIEAKRDRKKVIELAKRLATSSANKKT